MYGNKRLGRWHLSAIAVLVAVATPSSLLAKPPELLSWDTADGSIKAAFYSFDREADEVVILTPRTVKLSLLTEESRREAKLGLTGLREWSATTGHTTEAMLVSVDAEQDLVNLLIPQVVRFSSLSKESQAQAEWQYLQKVWDNDRAESAAIRASRQSRDAGIAIGDARQIIGNGKPPWYEGGTLHKATVADWWKASPSNRLATCADFVAKMKNKDKLQPRYARDLDRPNDFLPLAYQMMSYINAAAKLPADDDDASEFMKKIEVAQLAAVGFAHMDLRKSEE